MGWVWVRGMWSGRRKGFTRMVLRSIGGGEGGRIRGQERSIVASILVFVCKFVFTEVPWNICSSFFSKVFSSYSSLYVITVFRISPLNLFVIKCLIPVQVKIYTLTCLFS